MGYISSLVLLLVYLYTLKVCWWVKCSRLFFIVFSLFVLRLILSFNHEFSFQPIFAGQSLNALFSILSVGILFLSVDIKAAFSKQYRPYHILIISVFLSMVYSGLILGGVVSIMKWLFALLTTQAFFQLLQRYGISDVFKPFSFVFIGILISQLLSIVLGLGKDTESLVSSSNSISYIAGYAHEGAFSILIFMGLFLVSTLIVGRAANKLLLLFFFLGIVFANYRTVMMGAMVTLLFVIHSIYWVGARKEFKTKYVFFGVFIFIAFSLIFGGALLSRFSELGAAFSSLGELMTIDYSLFSIEEKRILSSRLYLWNMYLTGYFDFSFMGLILGAGPESWVVDFQVYAHNNFISALYGEGVLGCMSLIYLFISALIKVFYIEDSKLRMTIMGAILGFFVIANSTVPLWAIEGLYAFSIMLALILHLENVRKKGVGNV